MLATPYALVGAVLTLLIYLALTEQLDYASVRRRQLDAWAAISACVWLFGIAYGGATAVQERASLFPVRAQDVSAPAIPRLIHPDLSVPVESDASSKGEPARQPVIVSTSPDADTNPVPVSDGDTSEADRDNAGGDRDRSGDDRGMSASSSTGDAPLDNVSILAPEVAPVSEIVTLPTAMPFEALPTAAPVVIVLPSALPPPTSTPRPPAVEPRAPLQPTPHCGDPNEIEVQLSILDAYAERDEDRQVVRYKAEIENQSGFPVEITNVVVTAQDAKSGNDQFGNDRRSDLRIDALREFTLDGGVILEKHPSPFGRSELCVSFVTQTCGQRSRFPNTRRCTNISGY